MDSLFAGKGLNNIWLIRKATDLIFSLSGKEVICNIQGSKMILDTSDKVVAKTLYFTKVWESEVTSLLKSILKEGMVFVDVGANIGYFTLLGAKLANKVFAFEPDISNYDLLRRNVELNKYENVPLVNKAVTDKDGTMELFIDIENSGNHKLWASTKEQKQVTVDTVSLDSYFKSIDIPDIIKLDIQGAEMAALQGMDNIIRTNPNLKLIIEIWADGIRGYGDSPEELIGKLLTYGFRLYRITTKGLVTADIPFLLELCKDESNKEQFKFTNLYCERN